MGLSTPDALGSVLIIGGCGFVGFHIVRHFLREQSCTSVSVISRNPTTNCLPGVSYHAGDISDYITIRALLEKIQPNIIIHAACPAAISANLKTFEKVTVQGTRNLLTAASEIQSVRAFIFTSSATMAAGAEHIDLPESAPLADTVPTSHPYAKTKAKADKMVLAANQTSEKPGGRLSSLRTACIRLPIVYGERDLVAIPGALTALEKGQTNFQLGSGENIWDFCDADNAAAAHVLLAKALMKEPLPVPKVDGEAFNITDGQPQLFWDFPRLIWNAAGHDTTGEKKWIMPTWLALLVASVLEWAFWVATFGTRRPGQLGRQQVEYSCYTHTYRIDKARERLGYNPVSNFEQGILKAVKWNLDEGGCRARLKRKG